MKKIIKHGVVFIGFIWMSGCGQGWRFAARPPTTMVYDSIHITKTITEYKDTTIFVYIPADTVVLKDTIILKPDAQGVITYPYKRLDVQYAWSEFWIANSKPEFRLYQKDSEIAKTIANAIKESSTHETIYVEKPYPVEAALTWRQQTLIKAGTVFLALIGAGILILLTKLFLKR